MTLLEETMHGCRDITGGDYARVVVTLLEETMQGLP